MLYENFGCNHTTIVLPPFDKDKIQGESPHACLFLVNHSLTALSQPLALLVLFQSNTKQPPLVVKHLGREALHLFLLGCELVQWSPLSLAVIHCMQVCCSIASIMSFAMVLSHANFEVHSSRSELSKFYHFSQNIILS